MQGLELTIFEMPAFVAGILLVFLGGWTWWRARNERAEAALAAFFAVTGGYFVLETLGSGPRGDWASLLGPYFLFAIPLTAAAFALRHRARVTRQAEPRFATPALLAGYLGLAAAFTVDRTLFIDPTGIFDFGPLWALRAAPVLTFAALTLVLLRSYRESRAPRVGLFALALAFAVAAAVEAGFAFIGLAELVTGSFALETAQDAADLIAIAGAVLLTIAVVGTLVRALRSGDAGERVRGLVFAGAVLLTMQLPVLVGPIVGGPGLDGFVRTFVVSGGIALLAAVGLCAFAVLRMRVPGGGKPSADVVAELSGGAGPS